jgi:hypothetical protein
MTTHPYLAQPGPIGAQQLVAAIEAQLRADGHRLSTERASDLAPSVPGAAEPPD